MKRFIHTEIQYCQDMHLPNSIYRFNAIQKKKSRKLFCGYQQIESKVYMKRRKVQNSQHDIEKGQSWLTDTT